MLPSVYPDSDANFLMLLVGCETDLSTGSATI